MVKLLLLLYKKIKKILLKIASKTQKINFQPVITKLLYTYMSFAINSLDFSLMCL